MPTVPVACAHRPGPFGEIWPATFSGQWLVTKYYKLYSDPHDEQVIKLDTLAGEYAKVAEATVNASVFDNYPGLKIGEGYYMTGVLATDRDPRGCSVTVRDSGPFSYAPPFGERATIYMAVDFTYPDEWDDGWSSVYYLLPVCDVTHYLFRVHGKAVLYGSTSTPTMVPGIRRPEAVLVEPSIYSSGSVTPNSINGFGPIFYSDETSIAIKNDGVTTSLKAQTESLKTGMWLNVADAPYHGGSTINHGTIWSVPAAPAIDFFTWTWGDGNDDDILSAVRLNGEDSSDYANIYGPTSGISHEFDDATTGIYLRATDIYGRTTRRVFLIPDKPITGENRLSTAHNIHGELYIAQTKRAPDPPGVSVRRSPTNYGSSQQVSFIPDAKKPGIYHNSDSQLFIGYVDPVSGNYNLYSTLDCGETWDLMTETPFDNENFYPIVPCNGMSDGQHALIAFPRKTTNVYFSLFDGAEWSEPKLIFSTGTSGKILSFFQENFAGSSRLRIVGNGLDMSSMDYGLTWNATSST